MCNAHKSKDYKPALVDSSGCFNCNDLNTPKAKGRFGLAWVAETPECPCPEPIGWQVEFIDSPSKVEQRCQEMVRWINCPPMLPRCEPCPPEECCNPCCPPRCNPCVPQTTPCLPKCCSPCCTPCSPCARCCPPKCGIPKSTPNRRPCYKPCCAPCCMSKQAQPRVAGGGGGNGGGGGAATMGSSYRSRSPTNMCYANAPRDPRCCPMMCTCNMIKQSRRRSPRRKSPKRRRCICCDSEPDMCTCSAIPSCCKCKQEMPKCTCNGDEAPTKETTMESTSPSSTAGTD